MNSAHDINNLENLSKEELILKIKKLKKQKKKLNTFLNEVEEKVKHISNPRIVVLDMLFEFSKKHNLK